ncbi:AraC family transcriptional regulator [Chromobacterium sp. IIBBL 290-4]|nr:AraC family transcriptional regulator [Chromobacterium sp. IIBBL 290-4]UTH74779.1 AraC family transcriptional regulator [Chromobacterium sp. IIBBL 290-4]
MSAHTDAGQWAMPMGCLGWAPPGHRHGAAYHGPTRGHNFYFAEAWSRARMPPDIRVVRATPLLAALLEALRRDDLDAERRAPYCLTLADALSREPCHPFYLPMPSDARLRNLAARLMAQPASADDLDTLAHSAGMSRRTLMRRFQNETGWSLGQWRRQMRLRHALQALAEGASITAAGMEAGYDSLGAFSSAFKRFLGKTPSEWQAKAIKPGLPD